MYTLVMKSRDAIEFKSAFGGLWTDRRDAKEVIELRHLQGELQLEDFERLTHFVERGFVILEGAIPVELCDLLASELVALFKEGSNDAVYQAPDSAPFVATPIPKGLDPERMKVVDYFAVSEVASKVLASPEVTHFLTLLFESQPLCFQSLTFEKGSQQGFHQDTAYVVIDKPLEFAASWIALEDIEVGSGELMYLDGSHNLPDWKFGGNSKHWDQNVHGDEEHEEWAKSLIRRSEELGLEKKFFHPKKGDVLIWAADLVHGGSPIGSHELTRRSIVGHYCPQERIPNYFRYLPDRVKVKRENIFFSSAYYDLGPKIDFQSEL